MRIQGCSPVPEERQVRETRKLDIPPAETQKKARAVHRGGASWKMQVLARPGAAAARVPCFLFSCRVMARHGVVVVVTYPAWHGMVDLAWRSTDDL